jgi:hypothetical protein
MITIGNTADAWGGASLRPSDGPGGRGDLKPGQGVFVSVAMMMMN